MAAATSSRRRGWRRVLRWTVFWLPLWFVLITVGQVALLRWVPPLGSAFMLDRQVEGWLAGDWRYRVHYQWRDRTRISPQLPIALVAAEDQLFPLHHGFDFKAIDKALEHNRRGRRVRGASTISQQVAKNLFLWSGRSYVRKGLEAWYTVLIETLWSKQRIIEVYANIAEFGDGVYGAEAAARSFYGTSAAKLTLPESARMAAVLPSPRRYSVARPGAYVARRARWIELQVRRLGGPGYLSGPP